MKIKAGPWSSDAHWGRSFRDLLKAKALNTLYSKEDSQILSENYSVGMQMSNSGSDSETYESYSGDYSDFYDKFEESATSDRRKTKPDPTIVWDDVDEEAYQDELIATSEWVAEYNENQRKKKEKPQNMSASLKSGFSVHYKWAIVM